MADSRKRNLWPFPAGRDLKEWGDRVVQLLRKGDYLDIGYGLSYDGGILNADHATMPGGRLGLNSNAPYTLTATAAGTLYYTPAVHNRIALYDGTDWVVVSFSQLSITLSTLTASTLYDVFGYLSSGALALETVAWSSSTLAASSRATALALQDGRLVKSGDATRLYLGTIYNDASQQCNINNDALHIWNMYNRQTLTAIKQNSTAHTYGTASYRYWNNSATTLVVQTVLGISTGVTGSAYGYARYNSGGANSLVMGIAFNALAGIYNGLVTAVAGQYLAGTASIHLDGQALGLSNVACVEYGSATVAADFATGRISVSYLG